jgi:hypothetical protein
MIALFTILFHDALDYQLLEWVEGRDVEAFLEEMIDLVLQKMCCILIFHILER